MTEISRSQIKLNKSFPTPTSCVQGHFESIALANELGVRMQTVPKNTNKPNYFAEWRGLEWITVDNHTYYYGGDVSLMYADYHDVITQDQTFIGDAIIPHSGPQHISSPWSQYWWVQPVPKTHSKPLLDRQGWCCIMRRNDTHRDLVTKHIQPLFEHDPNWFVYHGIAPEHDHLVSKMFRPPIKNDSIWSSKYGTTHRALETWHQECILEIVPEGSHSMFYATEKIAKPIAAQQTFVVVGHHGYLRRLRQMGFKTFHPYIDESYDLETDLETRVKMCLSAVDQFLQAGKHLDELQHIVNHNKIRLQQIQAGTSYLQYIAKKIKKLII